MHGYTCRLLEKHKFGNLFPFLPLCVLPTRHFIYSPLSVSSNGSDTNYTEVTNTAVYQHHPPNPPLFLFLPPPPLDLHSEISQVRIIKGHVLDPIVPLDHVEPRPNAHVARGQATYTATSLLLKGADGRTTRQGFSDLLHDNMGPTPPPGRVDSGWGF